MKRLVLMKVTPQALNNLRRIAGNQSIGKTVEMLISERTMRDSNKKKGTSGYCICTLKSGDILDFNKKCNYISDCGFPGIVCLYNRNMGTKAKSSLRLYPLKTYHQSLTVQMNIGAHRIKKERDSRD